MPVTRERAGTVHESVDAGDRDVGDSDGLADGATERALDTGRGAEVCASGLPQRDVPIDGFAEGDLVTSSYGATVFA